MGRSFHGRIGQLSWIGNKCAISNHTIANDMHSARLTLRGDRVLLQHMLKQQYRNAVFILERRPWLYRGKHHGKERRSYPIHTLPDGTPAHMRIRTKDLMDATPINTDLHAAVALASRLVDLCGLELLFRNFETCKIFDISPLKPQTFNSHR